jgi:hypothetical protein
MRFGRHIVVAGLLALVAALISPAVASATHGGDREVTVGSNDNVFSQNKQNEPAVAVDANHPNVLAAGANDNIDMEACNAGDPTTCPFTEGVGGSGVQFSFDSGDSWIQPTYTGWSARHCVGEPGFTCTPTVGPIGTLPWYFEEGLVSDGDPAVTFGPQPGPDGTFDWANGSRLYYANLTSNFSAERDEQTFKGFEGIGVSRIDGQPALTPQIVADKNNWMRPVIASKQSSATFADKEQIWADNAASSEHFGNVYVCYAAFRGNSATSNNQPLDVLTSRDGGNAWTQHQVTPATNNTKSRNGFGRSGCTVRTDSDGVVYVFDFQFGFSPSTAAAGKIQMIRSFDGGAHWERPVNIFTAFDTCNAFEPSIGRCVEDGVGGARSDLSPAPSVDIANGAPTGDDASNRLVLTWVDGQQGLNHEHVKFSTSTTGGSSWSTPIDVERTGDRGYYSAPAISPDGTDVWLVYNAFTEDFKTSAVGAANDRPLVGQVLHAMVGSGGVGTFTSAHRGASGDARGSSQNNLAAEFLGDYVYAAATRDYGVSVWNDVRNAADCDAIDRFRQDLHDAAVATGQPTADPEEPRGEMEEGEDPSAPVAPDVQQKCPASFGNSDIFGWSSLAAP